MEHRHGCSPPATLQENVSHHVNSLRTIYVTARPESLPHPGLISCLCDPSVSLRFVAAESSATLLTPHFSAVTLTERQLDSKWAILSASEAKNQYFQRVSHISSFGFSRLHNRANSASALFFFHLITWRKKNESSSSTRSSQHKSWYCRCSRSAATISGWVCCVRQTADSESRRSHDKHH